jgi:hypothetical protein
VRQVALIVSVIAAAAACAAPPANVRSGCQGTRCPSDIPAEAFETLVDHLALQPGHGRIVPAGSKVGIEVHMDIPDGVVVTDVTAGTSASAFLGRDVSRPEDLAGFDAVLVQQSPRATRDYLFQMVWAAPRDPTRATLGVCWRLTWPGHPEGATAFKTLGYLQVGRE